MTVYTQSSLIPGSSLPPVFDILAVSNTAGEGLGDFITCDVM